MVRSLAAGVALTLLIPAVTASWGFQGAVEPDTHEDIGGGLMFDEADTAAVGARVYFNAVAVHAAFPVNDPYLSIATTGTLGKLGGVQPNLLPGARIVPVSMQVIAYLGLWKDCNRDGYVGAAQSALWDYPAELLPEDTACAPDGRHHVQDARDGRNRIYEWLPIGYDGGVVTAQTAIWDNEAMVWGDFGLPGTRPVVACRLHPLPSGTTGGTGGFLTTIGCSTGYAASKLVNMVDTDGSLGLRFEDPERPSDCTSRLGGDFGIFARERCANRTGVLEPGRADPTFTTWDCTNENFVSLWDPTAKEPGTRGELSQTPNAGFGLQYVLADDQGRYVGVPKPAPDVRNAQGSLWHATAHALGGVFVEFLGDFDDRPCERGHPTLPPDQWNPANQLEDEAQPRTDVKRTNDFVFEFHPWPFYGDRSLTAEQQARADYVMAWRPITQPYNAPDQPGGLVRQDLQAGGPVWMTMYARVGKVTRALADVPGLGVYAAIPCGEATTGTAGEWDCDATRWWNPAHGAPARPTMSQQQPPQGEISPLPLGAIPRDVFHLRDVDCYDGSLYGGGPQASLVSISGEDACPQLASAPLPAFDP